VHHALPLAVKADAGFQLHLAAGVSGGDNSGLSAIDGFHLARQDLHRHFVAHDVISAGAAATDIGAGHFLKRDAGNAGK
jgi:hypothetical protein